MKRAWILTLILWVGVTASVAAEYSRPIRGAIEAIRKDAKMDGLPRFHGYLAGYPGYHGAYILNYPRIYGNATRQDVERMLKDPNPVIRLTGVMVAINHQMDPQLFKDLSTDATLLSVGPFPKPNGTFREMKVSEVLVEMLHDSQFLLRHNYGQAVRLDYVREESAPTGSNVVLGKVPDYPIEMARAGINGEVTAKIRFNPGSTVPEVRILKASHAEFAEAATWALGKWELMKAGTERPAAAAEFECRVIYEAVE